MTIIAAIRCLDGTLMCADAEESVVLSDTNSQVSQIAAYRAGDATLLIGGAGDSRLIHYVQQTCIQEGFSTFAGQADPQWDRFESFLAQTAGEIFQDHIKTTESGRGDEPDAEFLVAVQADRARLYRWRKDHAYQVPDFNHAVIGIGTLVADSLLKEAEFYSLANQMLVYAVRLMMKVKSFVSDCGAYTDISLLRGNGTVYRYATKGIQAIERLIQEVERAYVEDILGVISHIRGVDADVIKADHRDMLLRFRDRYQEIVASEFPRV